MLALPSNDDRAAFIQRQRSFRPAAQMARVGTTIMEPKAGADGTAPSGAAMLAEIFTVPAAFVIGGQTVTLREPRVGEVKALVGSLVAAAGKDQARIASELQSLMLQCVEFRDGAAPANRSDWFDSLPVSDAFRLSEKFAGALDISAFLARVESVTGKLEGVLSSVGAARRRL